MISRSASRATRRKVAGPQHHHTHRTPDILHTVRRLRLLCRHLLLLQSAFRIRARARSARRTGLRMVGVIPTATTMTVAATATIASQLASSQDQARQPPWSEHGRHRRHRQSGRDSGIAGRTGLFRVQVPTLARPTSASSETLAEPRAMTTSPPEQSAPQRSRLSTLTSWTPRERFHRGRRNTTSRHHRISACIRGTDTAAKRYPTRIRTDMSTWAMLAPDLPIQGQRASLVMVAD